MIFIIDCLCSQIFWMDESMIHFDSYVWDGLKPPHKKTEVRPSGWVEAEFKVVGNSGWLGFCFATVPIWWKKHPSYVLLRKANAKHPVVLLQVLRGDTGLPPKAFQLLHKNWEGGHEMFEKIVEQVARACFLSRLLCSMCFYSNP